MPWRLISRFPGPCEKSCKPGKRPGRRPLRKSRLPPMKRGDVFWVDLPLGAGRAQAGLRPAILMQDDEGPQLCPTLVIVPLTSQLAAARFAHTVPLNPGTHSGLRVPSLALVAQVTAVDRMLLR